MYPFGALSMPSVQRNCVSSWPGRILGSFDADRHIETHCIVHKTGLYLNIQTDAASGPEKIIHLFCKTALLFQRHVSLDRSGKSAAVHSDGAFSF